MRPPARFLLAPAFVACSLTLPAAEPTAPAKVSYYKDIRPLFQQNCQGCHQPAKRGGDYEMTTFAGMMKAGESDKPAVVPGKPDKSYLIEEITAHDGKAEMPKGKPPLSEAQVKLIAEWVRQGAADDTPASAKAAAIDADHPPVYRAAPVVTSIAFSPDGELLAVAGYHEILLHKADGSGVAARLIGLSERVQALAFSPDGKRLAASGGDPGRFGEVQVWDVAKRKLTLSVPLTFDTLYGISWSPDGTLLGVGCADNTVRAVDSQTGKQVLFMGTHADWTLGTVFSRDGKHLVSASRDMTMKLTEVATQRFMDNVTSITPGALKGGLMTVDIRPVTERWYSRTPTDDGGVTKGLYDELLVGGADGVPRLYKMHRETKRVIGDDANKLKQYEAMPGRLSAVAFDKSGKRFAAASSLDGKGEVRVYDVASGKTVLCEGVSGPAYAVAWRPDGGVLASAGFDGVVWLHDPATGKLTKAFPAVPLTNQTAAK
jgi:WD40 repeat protein/mono/diheme cytochrome c family protein